MELAHEDPDEDLMWFEDTYTFAGPFYYDLYYEQWYMNTSWAIEFEDYFSEDEEDADEDEDIEEEYFDTNYF